MTRTSSRPSSSRATGAAATGLKPAAASLRETPPTPGPFHPQDGGPGRANDVVRAFATGLLVMYPMVAIVAVVVATSLLLGLGTPA